MPLRDRRRLLGALVLGAALLVAVLAWQRPNPFARHEMVHALFSDTDGLAPIGADVRMAGTPVGKVVGRRRVGDHAELTLELRPSAGTIHRDATAELRPHLMFEGSAYVDLRPGSRSAPPLGGGVLPLSRTRVYVPITDALGVLRARSRANLRSAAHSLAAVTGAPTDEQLQEVLRRAPALLEAAGPVLRAARGSHGDELQRAVTHLSATTHAVARQASDLPTIERSAAVTANALAGTSLDSTLSRLPATVASLRASSAALHDVADRLKPVAVDLRPAAAQLAPTLAAVKPLLNAATPAAKGARPLIGNLGSALDAVPATAPHARSIFTSIGPTLKVARGSLLPALERRTDLGTPAYLAFLGLFAGGGGASRPFGAQGEGHYMRFGLRFLTGAGQPLPPCTLLERANSQLAAVFESAGGCTP
jgi:ABC-type transporter Mla subunit MlaD